MCTTTRAVANLLAALSTGYILFFFSERLFWTVLWPGAAWPELMMTWLAYSAVAYLFLAVVSWSRADDLPSVFIAGAIYGWLIEGGVANTLYGTQSSAPFPWSISLTALSWHALISVVVGWWATKRALVATNIWPLAAIAVAVGVFWGVWAMFPRQESPPILVPVERFAGEAFVLTLALAASWRIEDRVTSSAFRPGWIGATISTLAVGLFYVQHVMALGTRALIILPALVGGAMMFLSIYRRQRGQIAGSSECVVSARKSRRLIILLLMPATGTMVFGVAAAAGWDRLPIAATVYVATGAAGFVLLIISMAVIARRRMM